MKKSRNTIAGLDIGTAKVRLAVGQLGYSEDNADEPELQILGASESSSSGMHRGVINSIEDVVSSVSECLESAERMAGIPIESVWVGISGLNIVSQESKGVVAVSKADNEISDGDVSRAVEASSSIATPLNYDVLHVLPKNFNIDGQANIRDPIGMTGIRLEVDSQIILGPSAQIKNLTKAIYRTGLDIDDLVLSILATAEAVATPRQKQIGVAVVNFGLATTSLAVFEEGDIIHTAVLPIGSEHVTNDIAIGLRTSIDLAEAVKLQCGNCLPQSVLKREECDLYDLGSDQHESVKLQYVSEIVEARVEEVLSKIDKELADIKRAGLLPAGVIFSGAGARLPGLVELAKKNLRLPAILGYPYNMVSVTDRVNDLGFSTAIGLVKWGAQMQMGSPASGSTSLVKGLKKAGLFSGKVKG